MMECSQTRKQTTHLNFVTPRVSIQFGSRNIRTMYGAGKEILIAREMEAYGLQLLGLSQVRWNSSVEFKLASGQLILFSGLLKVKIDHTQKESP